MASSRAEITNGMRQPQVSKSAPVVVVADPDKCAFQFDPIGKKTFTNACDIIKSALVAHPKVAEAAVVGYPHDIKGQGIYAYVTLKSGEPATDDLRKELVAWVRKEIGPIATPDQLQWAPGLPKTRSGKIMRRILRKIAENAPDQLGDISTLADPSVVQSLVDERLVK